MELIRTLVVLCSSFPNFVRIFKQRTLIDRERLTKEHPLKTATSEDTPTFPKTYDRSHPKTTILLHNSPAKIPTETSSTANSILPASTSPDSPNKPTTPRKAKAPGAIRDMPILIKGKGEGVKPRLE